MTEQGPTLRARVLRALYRDVDGASLAAFRVAFGLLMFFGTVRFMWTGWIAPPPVRGARVLLQVPRVEFVRTRPEWGMYLHCTVVAVLALCIALGLFYRASAVLFALAFAWIQLIDVTNYLNHYYFVVLLAVTLALLPPNRLWSVDAWRRPAIARETVPAWALYLLRFQVGVVYFNAGLAKLGTDWLMHAQPLGIWMSARADLPVIGPLLTLPWVPHFMSWAGFLFDTTIVLWLSIRRTRALGVCDGARVPRAHACVLQHRDVPGDHGDRGAGVLPAEWPRRFVRRAPMMPERAATAVTLGPGRRMALGAALVWCALQLVVPLRHWVYPGDVLWNEEGMRFSWKVMVREKNGSITYHVRDPRSGRRWQVSPSQYLLPRQANEMSGQPDLILQLARHIEGDFRRRGFDDVEVRAEAWVSLNGRKPRLMINPDVDLTRVRLGLLPATWILPGPSEPPLPAFSSPRPELASTHD